MREAKIQESRTVIWKRQLLPVHPSVIPEPGTEQLGRQLQATEQLYLKHGITTIQDGRTGKEEWKLLKYAAEQGFLHADVVAYAALNDAHELTEENPAYTGAYCNHLRIGGYKIFLDGSPQGRTTWVSRPYEGEPEGYCGYPILKTKRYSPISRRRSGREGDFWFIATVMPPHNR